jgi:YD repeat-containing protein
MAVFAMRVRPSVVPTPRLRPARLPRVSLLVMWLAALLMAAASVALAATVTYTYDALDRVVRAAYADGTVITYSYDAAGNILARSVGAGGVSPPIVTTRAASAVATTAATLNGTVSSSGAGTTVAFQFGPTASYGSSIAATPSPLAAEASNVPVSGAITGLTCNTTYHFRAVGTNSAGTTHGADVPFTTAACTVVMPPTVHTAWTSGIAATGATLNGTVSSNGAGTTVAFHYGTTTSYGSSAIAMQSPLPASAANAPVSAAISGLACNTLHHFRLAATNGAGTTNGTDATFTTAACAPSAYSRDYVQKAYVAYYGRPADPAGQAYWAARMDAEGQSLDAIIGAFGYSDEFNRRYGGLSYTALVTRIYQQALGRDPDPAGLAWYVAELEAGRRTLQTITLDVLNGATTAPDSIVVANKLEVAAYYTAKVAAGCAYGTEEQGVDTISGVTADAATASAAKAAIDARCGS